MHPTNSQPFYSNMIPLANQNNSFSDRPGTYSDLSPYLHANIQNPNPNLNFESQNSYKRTNSQPIHTHEMGAISENPANSSMIIKHSISTPNLEHMPHFVPTGRQNQDDHIAQGYYMQPKPYVQKENLNYNDRITSWEDDYTKESKINDIEESLDSGWFWIYRYWILTLYIFSVCSLVLNVVGIAFSEYTVYYIFHIGLTVWESVQYWYEYIAIKEKQASTADRAVQMLKVYMIGAPVVYIVASNSTGDENLSNGAMIWSCLVYSGMFYLFVMRMALKVRNVLRDRQSVQQSILYEL